MQPMAHKSEALLEPRDVNISGETYSGVPTKELRFGFGGEQPEKKFFFRKSVKIFEKMSQKIQITRQFITRVVSLLKFVIFGRN